MIYPLLRSKYMLLRFDVVFQNLWWMQLVKGTKSGLPIIPFHPTVMPKWWWWMVTIEKASLPNVQYKLERNSSLITGTRLSMSKSHGFCKGDFHKWAAPALHPLFGFKASCYLLNLSNLLLLSCAIMQTLWKSCLLCRIYNGCRFASLIVV